MRILQVSCFLALFALLGRYGCLGEELLPLLEESHVLLSDTTSYMFSDSAHYRHMTIVASVSVNGSVDMEKVNSIDSRSLAANVEDMSYGDNAIVQQTWSYPNGLVINAGTVVMFDSLTFSDNCASVGTYGDGGGDYGVGCSLVVANNATLILPGNFTLDKGCIRVLGGELRGAQNLTMINGAKIELSANSIWVSNSSDIGSIDWAHAGVKDYRIRPIDNYYRGKWSLDSLVISGASGIHISGGDDYASKETVPEMILHRLHILDDYSFISADEGGFTASRPLVFSGEAVSYDITDRQVTYNESVDNAWAHGVSGLWFGEGGTHAGSGGAIIGTEADSSDNFAYSAEYDPYGSEGTSNDGSYGGKVTDAWRYGRSKKSSAVSIQDCENSNPGTCSRRVVRSRGNALSPVSWGGSGGSSTSAMGGNGGGSIRITAHRIIENNGLITANGGDCDGDEGHGGGGAGGSVWLTVKDGGLFGDGTIRAEGGSGCWQGGGGGSGGRVAVHAAYPPSCTYDGDIHVGSGNQTQYRSGDTISGGATDLHAMPFPRYPAGGTIYLADATGSNGTLLATNNGAGGADIAIWADRVYNLNYTKVAIGALLLHDSGVHGYHHPQAGQNYSDGAVVLELGVLASLNRATVGASYTAGVDKSGHEAAYAPDSDGWEYSQQQQLLYETSCPSSVATCEDCKLGGGGYVVAAYTDSTGIWDRLAAKEHVSNAGVGGGNAFDKGSLYVTNNSVVVLLSHLHVEDFTVSVVNSTLFMENSVTIGRNGTLEVSPYTANKGDNATTMPMYSRGCVTAQRNVSVLRNISDYLSTAEYNFQSDIRGPRGHHGNKEYSWDFWRRMNMNMSHHEDTHYFHSFFEDDTDYIYTDSSTREGVAGTEAASTLFPYSSFPNQACLSLGHLWVSNGGRFRVMPVEVPPLTYNTNETGTVEIGETLTSSTIEYMTRFREGEFVGPISLNYTNAMAQRDIALQTLGMGAHVLVVARSVVVQKGGFMSANGVNPSRNQGWAPLNTQYQAHATDYGKKTDAYDRYSHGYDVSDEEEASPTLHITNQNRRTTDGHGQPSDGSSGGGGGGHVGPGTPGRLSHSMADMMTAGDRKATPQTSGGYGGLFRGVSGTFAMRPFGAGGAGGAGPMSSGGSGGGGLTILIQDFIAIHGTLSADGSNHGSSVDEIKRYGIGGGAGGSISIFSLNGTLYGDGEISARGAHGAVGGGGGSGGRVAVDSCTDSYTGSFDVRGGVAMLPLRQVHLLNQWASFDISATLQKNTYSNISQAGNYTDQQPYASRYFGDSAEYVAAKTAGSGGRILRSAGPDDELPVLIAAATGTVGRYTSWSTELNSLAFDSRCVMAEHRRARNAKVSIQESYTTADLFAAEDQITDGSYSNSYRDGDLGLDAGTLSVMSTTLVNAYRYRDEYFIDRNIMLMYDRYNARDPDNLVNTRREGALHRVPAVMPQRIPAMDTMVDLPLAYSDPSFTLTTLAGVHTQKGAYPAYHDDKYDYTVGELECQAGSHVSMISTSVGVLDLAIKTLTVSTGASVSFGYNVRLRGDETGNIDLKRGTFFARGGFSRQTDMAASLQLTMTDGAKLVLPAPLAYHKLLRSVYANQTHNATQEILDMELDFNYTHSLNKGPEDFSSEILGLQEGEVGQALRQTLKYNGANVSLTDAFFTALASVETHNFSTVNLTGHSAIIGPVVLIKAQSVHLHNSVISADGLGFYGGDTGENAAVYETNNGQVDDATTTIFTGTQYVPVSRAFGGKGSSGTGNGFAGGYGGDIGGDGGGHGGSTPYGRSSMYRHAMAEYMVANGVQFSPEQSVMPVTSLLVPGEASIARSNLTYTELSNSAHVKYVRARNYGNPYAPVLPGSGGGAAYAAAATGIGNLGGRGGGVVVVAVGDGGLQMTSTCTGSCEQSDAQAQFNISDVSLRTALGHYHTRISADGESVLGGGGAGAGGSVWIRYSGDGGTVHDPPRLLGRGLVSARGGETCFLPWWHDFTCAGQGVAQSATDENQGYFSSGPTNATNWDNSTVYYNVLNHPGGVGAGGRIRLELNDTHFEGVSVAIAGYSPDSTFASAYLSGHKGTIVSIPGILQDSLEPSSLYGKESEDPDSLMEDGIDILIYNHQLTTPDNQAAAQIAAVFQIQTITVRGTGRVIDGASSTSGTIVGGLWKVGYRGLHSDKVLSASASAQDVYEALAGIPNSELRHINVNRYLVGDSDYTQAAYDADSSTTFTSGYEWKVTFFDDQHSLSLIDVFTGSGVDCDACIPLYTVPTNTAAMTIELEPPPTTTNEAWIRVRNSQVATDFTPGYGNLNSFFGKYGAEEIRQLLSINLDHLLGNTSYAYWRSMNVLRLVPGGYSVDDRSKREALRSAILNNEMRIERIRPLPTLLGQLLTLDSESPPMDVPTPGPTGQPTGVPSGQPSMQPTCQPSSQPTGQPSSQPTGQPTGQPSSQPTGQPSSQPSRQPTGQPSSQPTGKPTGQPSGQPTEQPSSQPSGQPTGQPSGQPTEQPSSQPSGQPTGQPSGQPTEQPSSQPSGQPTGQPSGQPTEQPTGQPSGQPTGQPSEQPTEQPTGQPSGQPTGQPSGQPSNQPTNQPSAAPTEAPMIGG